METQTAGRPKYFGNRTGWTYEAGIRIELMHRLFDDLKNGDLAVKEIEDGVFSLKRKNGVEFRLFARYGEYHLDLVEEGSRLVVVPNDGWTFTEWLGQLVHDVRKSLNPDQSDDQVREEGWRRHDERVSRAEQKMRDLLEAW